MDNLKQKMIDTAEAETSNRLNDLLMDTIAAHHQSHIARCFSELCRREDLFAPELPPSTAQIAHLAWMHRETLRCMEGVRREDHYGAFVVLMAFEAGRDKAGRYLPHRPTTVMDETWEIIALSHGEHVLVQERRRGRRSE